MRYMVERNFVNVVGKIWMPAIKASTTYNLSKYDVENIGDFNRENMEQWLATHSGDFQIVEDFYATVGDKEIPWENEENELFFNDCMYGEG